MSVRPLRITILGLSITSSWGNGHATTYRALVRGLHRRGHDIFFLERDAIWYAQNRDLPRPDFCKVGIYDSLDALRSYSERVRDSDLVIVGSYVPEGIAVGDWALETARGVTAFYDIDTPVTLARLAGPGADYLTIEQVPRYDLYLSFTGGPILSRIEQELGSPMARALYCSVDEDVYFPERARRKWRMGYMGTYSPDRQPTVERLLVAVAEQMPAERFVVAGPQYPADLCWPVNVQRIQHLAPDHHRAFYNSQAITLNVTRADMIAAGHSPSVRLFEAAACGTPILSDWWEGLDTFFEPEHEILIAQTSENAVDQLRSVTAERRAMIGMRSRDRVLAYHTAMQRAMELEEYYAQVRPSLFAVANGPAGAGKAARVG